MGNFAFWRDKYEGSGTVPTDETGIGIGLRDRDYDGWLSYSCLCYSPSYCSKMDDGTVGDCEK